MSKYEIKYNKRGRMEYNLDFHGRQFKEWTPEEDEYLMKFYKYDGLKMLSYVLEKIESTVCSRYHSLKSRGYKVND
jgi:hypothetical protein